MLIDYIMNLKDKLTQSTDILVEKKLQLKAARKRFKESQDELEKIKQEIDKLEKDIQTLELKRK